MSELERLERRVDRERRARREAEEIAESITGALYDKQRELVLLEAVATGANEASTIREALQGGIDRICAHTSWPVGHAYLVAASGAELTSAGVWHLDDPERAETFRRASERLVVPVGKGLIGRVAERAEPAWIEDTAAEADFVRLEAARAVGLRGAFLFPILIGSEAVGVLEFFTHAAAPPEPTLLNVMSQIGVQLGRVLERQRARDELAVARDRALDASRMKSAFLANMSHELRTPMNGVIGMTELLLDTALLEEQRGFAQVIQTSSEALLAVIDDALDFSSLETGSLVLEPSRFCARKVLADVGAPIAERARAKGLRFEMRVAPEVPERLWGDPVRLGQVMTNLLGNAVKFTDRGEVSIDVRAAEQTPEATLLHVEVSDTGIGVDPENIEALFDAFSQADGSLTRAHGGTGLGLAICSELVRVLGGRIGVRPRAEGGSTFWFTARLESAEGERD